MLYEVRSMSAPSGHSKPVDSYNIVHSNCRTVYSLFLPFFTHSSPLSHPISPRSTAPQRFSTSFRPGVLCGFGAAKISKCGKLDGFSKLIELNTLLIGILLDALTCSLRSLLHDPEEIVLLFLLSSLQWSVSLRSNLYSTLACTSAGFAHTTLSWNKTLLLLLFSGRLA